MKDVPAEVVESMVRERRPDGYYLSAVFDPGEGRVRFGYGWRLGRPVYDAGSPRLRALRWYVAAESEGGRWGHVYAPTLREGARWALRRAWEGRQE